MNRPYLAAFLGGATVSLLPSWLVAQISARHPKLAPEDLQTVTDFFSDGDILLQSIVFFIIVVIAPVFEELIFRGLLWRFFNWKLSSNWTWILISLIFAASHWETLHVIGLLPFSFFVGWLRLKTGGVGPSIVAHITNNAVGCLIMML